MKDLKISSLCNHLIIDEILSIDGLTPNYTAELKYNSNNDKSKIVIRDLYETDGMTNFIPSLNGITDFILTTEKNIVFNQNIGCSGVNFVDGITGYYPEKVYVATYIAESSDCPKCMGSNKQTDISFNAIGKINTVTKFEYLKQKVVKALITGKGNNFFSPDYGSNLVESIGKPNLAFVMLGIQQSILETVNRIIEVQSDFIDILEDDEKLIGLDNLVIMPGEDSRQLDISFNIINYNFEKEKISFNLKI
jgi:hypothetical protein